jgi:hypothetical protein
MTATDINTFIGSVIIVLATLGGGVQWLLTYIKAAQTEGELAEAKARTELSDRLYEEIRLLRQELANSHEEKRLFMRRIFQLENAIHMQAGMEMPVLAGWPPA